MAPGEMDVGQSIGGMLFGMLTIINIGGWNPSIFGAFRVGDPLIAWEGIQISIATLGIFAILIFGFSWGLPSRESLNGWSFLTTILVVLTVIMVLTTPISPAVRAIFGGSFVATMILLVVQTIGYAALVYTT